MLGPSRVTDRGRQADQQPGGGARDPEAGSDGGQRDPAAQHAFQQKVRGVRGIRLPRLQQGPLEAGDRPERSGPEGLDQTAGAADGEQMRDRLGNGGTDDEAAGAREVDLAPHALTQPVSAALPARASWSVIRRTTAMASARPGMVST